MSVPGFELEPLTAAHAEALRAIRRHPEVYVWWDELEDDFPLGDEPGSTRLTVIAEGRVAGMVQYSEENDPKYRHAEIDIFLDPALRGRGLGPTVIRRVAEMLMTERGHHRIVIGAAIENEAAIRAYRKAGFRDIGIERASERDSGGSGWHDALLMDLLAEDLGIEPGANVPG